MFETPQPAHAWLERLIGEWTSETRCDMGPDKPGETFAGTERVRSLGGLWVVAEMNSPMPGGGTSTALMTLGFDPKNNRYLGTFVASMMTHLWLYDGTLVGDTLTLDATGPSFAQDGTMAPYKDAIQIVSDDERILTSSTPGPDGAWHTFMTSRYRRTK